MTRINVKKRHKKKQDGDGLIDYIVNKLPEIHIPGYQYCGPGTELEKRLARGDPGINKLDQACKEHDIAYSKIQDSKGRQEADKALIKRAFPRIHSSDAKLGERAAALVVSGLMGAKVGLSKIGLGLKKRTRKKKMKGTRRPSRRRSGGAKSKKVNRRRKKSRSKTKRKKTIAFGKIVRGVKADIKKKFKSSSLNDTIKAAIRSAKNMKRNKSVKVPRVLKLPKLGGSVLPILPIVSALSGVGSISPSPLAVMKALKGIQSVKHDRSGQVAKKIGRGLNLISNSKGSGFYLKPFKQR